MSAPFFYSQGKSSSSKIAIIVEPKPRLAKVPAVMYPLTFQAVRPILINCLIEMSIRAKATVRSKDDNTIKVAELAPPPTLGMLTYATAITTQDMHLK